MPASLKCDKLLMNGRAAQGLQSSQIVHVHRVDMTPLQRVFDRHVKEVLAAKELSQETIDAYSIHLDQALKDIWSKAAAPALCADGLPPYEPAPRHCTT